MSEEDRRAIEMALREEEEAMEVGEVWRTTAAETARSG